MAKIPCDRTEYGLTFLAPKVLTTHDIIPVVVVVGEKVFFFTKFRQDSHYLINHCFFRIFFIVPTSYIPISRRLSKDLGTISKRYLIEVGHVKRRGSQAPLLRSPPRQMNLYRSTPYIYYLHLLSYLRSWVNFVLNSAKIKRNGNYTS